MTIRYKNKGRYAYQTKNIWNKEKKKYQTKWTYLGIVTPTGTFKKAHTNQLQEKLCLNYGDTHTLNMYCEKSGLTALLQNIYGDTTNMLLALTFYKLTQQGAMQHVQTWLEGNYANQLFKDTDLSTQKISELLKHIGNEHLHREFFKQYLQKTYKKQGIIIDSTNMPNNISFPLTAFGRNDGKIEKETKLLMVVDKETKNPLYFRYMTGNIVDVSTLRNTVKELNLMGVSVDNSLIDAGYCSEDNLTLLYEENISFLTRLPAGRKLFSELVNKTVLTLQLPANVVFFGDRVLYIEKVPLVLYGKFGAFAFVCCDISRRAQETVKLLKTAKEEKLSDVEVSGCMSRLGVFVLLSSSDVLVSEVLGLYYLRGVVEEVFRVSKCCVDLLPLRVHGEEAFRGVLFLNFLAVVLYKNFQVQLPADISVESALLLMRNWICKVFDDDIILPAEPTKKQKLILEAITNTVGKF
jgi:transposase